MNTTLKKTLLWTPRIAGILFVLFISLFAFDVFEEGLGFWGTLLALFMHLLPSILLAIAISIAWKREWFGAVLFIGWALFFGLLLQLVPHVCASSPYGAPGPIALLTGFVIILGLLWYIVDAWILAPLERATGQRWGLVTS